MTTKIGKILFKLSKIRKIVRIQYIVTNCLIINVISLINAQINLLTKKI